MHGSNEIPKDWQCLTLGEMASVVMGQSPPSSVVNTDGNGVPFLQGNAEFGTRTPTAVNWCTDPGRIAEPHDILISVRAPVGEMNIADQSYCVGRGLAAIRPEEDDRLFLWYAVQHHRRQLRRVAQGSTFEAINRDGLEQIVIPQPPADERERIGRILNSVDDAIENTSAVIEQTRRLRTAVLQDLLTHGVPGQHEDFQQHKLLGTLPATWRTVPLREVATVVDCKHRTPLYVEDGYPVVRPSDIKEGCLDLSGALRTTHDEYIDLTSHYEPRRGDIVYSRNASFGVAAYVDTNEQFTIGQDVVIISAGNDLNDKFLYYLLNSEKFRRQLQRLSAGSTFHRVNLEEIRNYAVQIPSAGEQGVIVGCLWQMDEWLALLEAELLQLNQSKAALSQALLTGRVRVNECEVQHA